MRLQRPTRSQNAFNRVTRSSIGHASPGSTKEPLRLPASISSEAIRVALRSKNRTKLESNYFEQVAAWSAGVAPAGWLVGWNILSNLRFWHKADIPVAPGNVRFWG